MSENLFRSIKASCLIVIAISSVIIAFQIIDMNNDLINQLHRIRNQIEMLVAETANSSN